ncbi:YfbM family protein [bacterium]|nr:YfbM family protein [bacterium]
MSAYLLQRVSTNVHRRLMEDDEFDETMLPPIEWENAESGEGNALDLGEWNEALHFLLSDTVGEDQPILDFLLVGYLDDEDLAGEDEEALTEWFEELAACPIVSTLGAVEVERIHHALEKVAPEIIQERYDPAELEESGVPPGGWGEDSSEDLAILLDCFLALKKFLNMAVESKAALLGMLFLED